MTMTATVGDVNTATEMATYHHNGGLVPDACECIARGETRTVYIDYNTDTVYKIGIDVVNRTEYQVLTRARLAGNEWAPPVTLYEVVATDQDGYDVECTVIAMPYLPEDGSVDHDGLVIMAEGAFDLNADNVVASGGQLWLIDAGGM